jgi:hypothetical protein
MELVCPVCRHYLQLLLCQFGGTPSTPPRHLRCTHLDESGVRILALALSPHAPHLTSTLTSPPAHIEMLGYLECPRRHYSFSLSLLFVTLSCCYLHSLSAL